MYGFMAAIREKGIQIPQNVSITSIGNTNLSRFANPPVTSVDLDLESHLEEAFKLLFYNLDNPEKMEFLRIIKPVLKERESVIIFDEVPDKKDNEIKTNKLKIIFLLNLISLLLFIN